MLAHLGRERQIEILIQSQRLTQVVCDEPVRRDLQLAPIYVSTVDSDNIFDSQAPGNRKPRTRPASEVDHAPWPDEIENKREDDLGRAMCARLMVRKPRCTVRRVRFCSHTCSAPVIALRGS